VWEFRVYLGRDPVSHKHRWASHTWHGTRKAAPRALAKWVAEQDADKPVVPTAKSVAWLLEEWFARQERAGLSPTTMERYRGKAALWILPIIGSKALKDLVPGDVDDVHLAMKEAGKADSTIRQAHAILRGALGYALGREWVDRNVAAMMPPPKQGRPNVLAPELDEVHALLAAAGEPGCDLWTCIALAAILGARAGELCGLRWSDIDLDAGTVRLERSAYTAKGVTGLKAPKTEKGKRVVAIDPLLAEVLRDRRAWQVGRNERVGTELVEDPYVLSFWSNGDGPPRPDSYSTAFGKLRSSLGLGHLHLHSLRHFAATELLDQGIPLAAVSQRLGHGSPATTASIYTHGVRGRDQEAAAVLGARVLTTRA